MELGVNVRCTKVERRIVRIFQISLPFQIGGRFVGLFADAVIPLADSHEILNQRTWYKDGLTYT